MTPDARADLRIVSFDLDGTLILPAIFNAVADALGFGGPLERTLAEYEAGTLSLEEAFHHDVRHFLGRDVAEMRAALSASDRWTSGIPEAVKRLKDAGLGVVLTTDQPVFLAEHVLDWGFDDLVASPSVVAEGRAVSVDPRFAKWPNLESFLARVDVPPRHVAHVGNGANDIPVFERVGYAVAVNPSGDAVAQAADYVVQRLENLNEVVDHLLETA